MLSGAYAIFTHLKNYDFCDASVIFQASHKMVSSRRLLTLCHVCAALTLRFIKASPSPGHKMLHEIAKCISTKCCACHEKPPGSIDTLPKYCPCHSTCKRHRKACHKTPQKHAACEEIHLQQIILSHFVRAAQRQGINAIPRTANSRVAEATVGEHTSTPTDRREPFATHSGKGKSFQFKSFGFVFFVSCFFCCPHSLGRWSQDCLCPRRKTAEGTM